MAVMPGRHRVASVVRDTGAPLQKRVNYDAEYQLHPDATADPEQDRTGPASRPAKSDLLKAA